MNVFQLLFFVFFCLGLGFLGYLISPRYGWLAVAVVATPVLILQVIGSWRQLIRETRYGVHTTSPSTLDQPTSRPASLTTMRSLR
jgi:hypothetical protein